MAGLSASPVVEYRRHVSRGQQDGHDLHELSFIANVVNNQIRADGPKQDRSFR
jgi:hypothetical protein